MSQVMTNYTTYDLAYYYADLGRLPRFSNEERQQLIASNMQTTRLDPQVRNRLIEGHLSLATHVALDRCPPAYYRSLPDILGEVALTLVNVTDRYDFQTGKDFTSYVVACTDGVVKQTIGGDRLIRVPSSVLWKAKQKGTEKLLYDLQPDSLDKWMEWYNTDEVEEPPTAPLLPTNEAPPRNPERRAQVQEWLSYLSPRAQNVLTLRYGLSDEDERCLPPTEIAQVLGLKCHTVHYIERDALQRIRALIEGTATVTEKNGQHRITGIYKRSTSKPPTLTLEYEALFRQVATCLCEQGIKVSGRLLAKETGKNVHLAQAFLRLHRHEFPLVTRDKTSTLQERLEHVGHVYAQLEAQGKEVSTSRLAKIAQVRKQTAREFMRTHKGEHHAA